MDLFEGENDVGLRMGNLVNRWTSGFIIATVEAMFLEGEQGEDLAEDYEHGQPQPR